MRNSIRTEAVVSKVINGNQINWNQVYYFSKIAAAGSIKDAALQLELSPSTLSLHLSQLESDLELLLFFRHHRRLELTPEGSRLFIHAKTMFESGQRMIDVVSPLPLGAYPVSVGLVPSPSIQIANRLIAAFLRLNKMNMKLFHSVYSELEENLAAAKLDFGFSDRMPERKDIRFTRVSDSSLRFYVAPGFENKTFRELIQELPLLICNAQPEQRSFAEQALLEADLLPSSVVTSDYPSTLIELCEQGIGIGVFSGKIFEGGANRPLNALRAPRDAPELKDSLYALWSADGENSMAVRCLLGVLKAQVLSRGV